MPDAKKQMAKHKGTKVRTDGGGRGQARPVGRANTDAGTGGGRAANRGRSRAR